VNELNNMYFVEIIKLYVLLWMYVQIIFI